MCLLWFAGHVVRVRRLLTDNTLVYRPGTTGKAERFNRTLLTECAYALTGSSNSERAQGLDRFMDHYNTERGHSALVGRPPISQLTA